MDKYLRAYALIHTGALKHNIQIAKNRVGTDTKIMAVIKTNAYGHGAVRTAKELMDDVYGFAVATIDEAVELREAGIKNMILILGYISEDDYDALIMNDITTSLLTYEMAVSLNARAKELGQMAKCHVKINTGMNRIGFPVDEETVEIIKKVRELKNLESDGIFMHFATADEEDKEFSHEQYRKFTWILKRLHEENVDFAIRHCCNSAAILDLPEMKLDMVRDGITLYGLYPSEYVRSMHSEMNPVMELKSHIIFIKTVKAGEGISYGRTYITSKDTRIATVSIGYGDGYPRTLSSKGYVLIHGKKAPITGRVCMDQFMIDVTGIDNVCVGDTVTLMGRDGDEVISAEELAELSGRFNYELVCDINSRVERVYAD